MIPNIKEVNRKRNSPKKGRKRIYSDDIYEERFHTIERAFAEDRCHEFLRDQPKPKQQFGFDK